MTGLRIYTSNKLEILAQRLAELVKSPLPSPLDKEVIVVQSRGMERWLSMQLAQRLGICSNCIFPFPNALLNQFAKGFFPDIPEESPFDPGIMTWLIMKFLPYYMEKPEFEPLRAYIKGPNEELRLYQLSERIADTFDQYLLFRPQMIFRWEQGHEENWQAVLWRKIVSQKGNQHRAAMAKHLIETIDGPPGELEGLPKRVSLFGISALPKLHMQVLSSIARAVQVNMFLMNPCKEYWGDTISDWEAERTAGRAGAAVGTELLYLNRGNSLLGSWGRLGRDFFDVVAELPCEEAHWFEEPEGGNLLSRIQSDILNLKDRQEIEREIWGRADSSVQIHSCHSPMREIEVLQDNILQMFEQDPGLTPRDILVMTPDIEVYAPYIRAVFELPTDDRRRIPFSIADRSIRKEGSITAVFLNILDLKGGRFKASQVLDLLESGALRKRFGLSASDIELIRGWVRDVRIRWGIDSRNRVELGLPGFVENTWEAGIRRLLLGYAMPQKDETLFEDILPYSNMEGDDPRVLGRFIEFTKQLFNRVKSLEGERNPRQWREMLIELLDSFFLPGETEIQEVQVIRRSLSRLGGMMDPERAGFEGDVALEAVRHYLSRCLERESLGSGFIAGGITFCTILPMRSIPFRVICLVGMNNDAFPRQSPRLGFDLMALNPEPGDRSRRKDDRYLFLEAVLSARDKFYISYVGQSVQDNSTAPPSVIVSELIDYIVQGFDDEENKGADRLITRHRLQAFSPEYFRPNEGLFSFSLENFQAAERLLKARIDPAPFISKGLPPPTEVWKNVDLEDLYTFFGNPTKYLLQRRLMVSLADQGSILEERESFEVTSLDRYHIESMLLKQRLCGGSLGKLLPVMRAGGFLPYGSVGECEFRRLSTGIENFVEELSPYITGQCLEPLDVDLSIADFRLIGRIQGIYADNLVQYRYANVRPKDRLRLWIQHLVLNILAGEGYPRTSILAGLKKKSGEREWGAWEYSPVKKSRKILENLLKNYWDGLSRPLLFFPQSSLEYCNRLFKGGKTPEEALENARKEWVGSEYSPGECSDDYYALCFGNKNPIDSDFMNVSEEIFGPLLGSQNEL